MASSVVQTPRDRLQRILDYGVRARRYWWVATIFVLLGAGLSVGFAVSRPSAYASTAVLFYQERIMTGLIQGRDAAVMQRNIGERYRELLLARSSLSQIIEDERGYHIVRVRERIDAGQVPFIESQEKIKSAIQLARREAEYKKFVEALRTKTAVWTVYDNEPALARQPAGTQLR